MRELRHYFREPQQLILANRKGVPFIQSILANLIENCTGTPPFTPF